MASQTTIIRINHVKPVSAMQISKPSDNPRAECVALAALLERIAAGMETADVVVQAGGTLAAYATGTATLSSCVATDVLTINGVPFAVVASGATGNQVNKGADDTATAANFAAKINASATAKIKNYVTASSAAAVVTVTAYVPGLLGNLITLAQTGNHITVSAAALAGGAGGDVASVTYKRS
jgi:phage tail sheath gpL-like